MMDNYYGNKGEVFKQRDANIGAFVHDSMKFEGDYDHSVSGREGYLETYGKKEGWDKEGVHFAGKRLKLDDNNDVVESEKDFEYNAPWGGKFSGFSGTMEISRHVRNGVKKYGGKIVFECSGMSWDGAMVEDSWVGDTQVEAQFMMPYFAAQKGSPVVDFGAGKFEFQYNGKTITPDRAFFRSKWLYGQDASTVVTENEDEKTISYLKDGKEVKQTPRALYWKFD
jgi:hypothetical protein